MDPSGLDGSDPRSRHWLGSDCFFAGGDDSDSIIVNVLCTNLLWLREVQVPFQTRVGTFLQPCPLPFAGDPDGGVGGDGGDEGRGTWELTDEGTDAKIVVRGRTYWRHKTTGLWWSRDTAGHGGSAFKVYEERGGQLEWLADADKFGDYIGKKHKGPKGLLIRR